MKKLSTAKIFLDKTIKAIAFEDFVDNDADRAFLRESLISILREPLYKEIYFFFKEAIHTCDYDVVIIVANKCYNFYKLLLRIMPLEEPSALVISDDAIPYFSEGLQGKRILILDDIVEYARSLKRLQKELLSEKYEAVKVDIKTFIKSDRQPTKTHGIRSAAIMSKDSWRFASQRLVSAFDMLGQPNTYCGPMLQIDISALMHAYGGDDTALLAGLFDFATVDEIQCLQPHVAKLSRDYLVVPKTKQEFNCFKPSDFVYFHAQLNRKGRYALRLVPFVIFDRLSSEQICTSVQRVREAFAMNYTEASPRDETAYVQSFRFAQYALRLANCYELFTRIEPKIQSAIIDNSDLLMSFGQKEQDALTHRTYAKHIGYCLPGATASRALSPPSISNYARTFYLYTLYFFQMKLRDEKNAPKNPKRRIIVLPWHLLLGKVIKGVDPIGLIKGWLACLITSIAALKADFDDKKQLVRLITCAGEHSYSHMEMHGQALLKELQKPNTSKPEKRIMLRNYVRQYRRQKKTEGPHDAEKQFANALKVIAKESNVDMFNQYCDFISSIDVKRLELIEYAAEQMKSCNRLF
ncbi:MAG: hypothetical protein FWD25_07045 [Clostridia bacterium]|nr:hypothetical protein [Clostridia bacterium]